MKRRLVVSRLQRAARRLDCRYLELVYQASYLDLASRTQWLSDVPLASPSGGTASFSQLFVLLSGLTRFQPSRVLDIGTGCSTRLFVQYGAPSTHVDDDAAWLAQSVGDAATATTLHAPLRPVTLDGRSCEWYGTRPTGEFDLILVDGPQAWDRTRRFNRLGFLTWIPEVLADEFVIVVDDTSRRGERELVDRLLARLGARVRAREIVGATSQTVLATPRFAGMLYL